MAQKTIVTRLTLGIEDPTQGSAEVRDPTGTMLLPASVGLAHVAPGTPVTLDAAEADWIISTFGGEVLEEISDQDADEDDPEKPPKSPKSSASDNTSSRK